MVDYNGQPFGRANAGADTTFSLADLIAHAAKTRNLTAGAIIGSGTVSNQGSDGDPGKPIKDGGLGYSCIACLLYTSPSPRDKRQPRMPSSA